jgi:hypothetical protein
MMYLIVVSVALILFFGFLGATVFETKQGTRFFGNARAALDARVSRLAFVMKHVDFGKFFFHLIRDGAAHLAHEIARFVLIAVRFVERSLTRFVRYLRGRRAANGPSTTPAVSSSVFVETMTYFKHTLRRSRQQPPVVPPEVAAGEDSQV